MMNSSAHDILWGRWKYALTPQHDIYSSLREKVMGASVLEVGFGTGAGVLQYAMVAEHVDAIEIDPGAVRFAKDVFPLNNVNWIEADITSWYTAETYDYAIMIETLEHISEWRKAVTAIKAHLIPGGYLIMSARNANADLRRYKDLHEREWTAQQFLDNLSIFFSDVNIYDWTLNEQQNNDTRLTPLMAIAKKGV